jgi:hypothetical protein
MSSDISHQGFEEHKFLFDILLSAVGVGAGSQIGRAAEYFKQNE